MSAKANNFNSFMQRSGVCGIRNVTMDYAYKDDSVTFDALVEKYGITRRAVGHCIDYAIINCLVSYNTGILVKKKSHRNQSKHMKVKSVRTPSDKHYDEIFDKRLAYIKNLPDEKVIEIAYLYMANPNMPVKDLAKSLRFSSKEINLLLVKAIKDNLVEEGVIRYIYANSLMKSKSISEFNSRYDYFKKLEDVRKSNVTK